MGLEFFPPTGEAKPFQLSPLGADTVQDVKPVALQAPSSCGR
jgi:hypothetical protein